MSQEQAAAAQATEEVVNANDTSVTEVTTAEGTAGDDDGDFQSDAKLDAAQVNEIVKKRLVRANAKTREQVKAEAEAEIDYWRSKASEKKEPSLTALPPKPVLVDYASNPSLYEKDMEKWSQHKAYIDGHQAQVQNEYNARCTAFQAKQPDFDKAVKFFNAVTVPQAVEVAILESEVGPQVAYHLAKNFKEFDRISKLSPVSQVRELAKIELKLTGQATEPVITVKPQPKPTSTVTGTSPATVTKDYSSMTQQQKADFMTQRKKAHRRG